MIIEYENILIYFRTLLVCEYLLYVNNCIFFHVQYSTTVCTVRLVIKQLVLQVNYSAH